MALNDQYLIPGLFPFSRLCGNPVDIRKLVLLGNVFLNKDSLEYEIAQRQLAVKSYESKSWFSVCNRLLYKYKLLSIYNVCKNIESMKKWKQLVNTAIDTYVLSQ